MSLKQDTHYDCTLTMDKQITDTPMEEVKLPADFDIEAVQMTDEVVIELKDPVKDPQKATARPAGLQDRYPGPQPFKDTEDVPGLPPFPTKAETDVEPFKYTWEEVKGFIGSGQLNKRDWRSQPMQLRYIVWRTMLIEQYGSIANFLISALPWCQPKDTSASSAGNIASSQPTVMQSNINQMSASEVKQMASTTGVEPKFLQWNGSLDPNEYIILKNDWPYKIPREAGHFCIWSKHPIVHPVQVDYDEAAWESIKSKGMGGFTGVPAGQGEDITPYGGEEMSKMVKGLWDPRGWECAWFLNATSVQSVPELAHFQVIARRKTEEEIAEAERLQEQGEGIMQSSRNIGSPDSGLQDSRSDAFFLALTFSTLHLSRQHRIGMQPIIYDGDMRYPAPDAYPPPKAISGLPTQAELDAQPRLFSFGELKEIIRDGDLGFLMRNKKLEVRYFKWAAGIKEKYGSTEEYLTNVRLPWARPTSSEPWNVHNHSKNLSIDLSHLDLPPSPTSLASPHFNAYPPPLSPKGEPGPNALEPDVDHVTESIESTGGAGGNVSSLPPPTPRGHVRTPSITISSSNIAECSKSPASLKLVNVKLQKETANGSRENKSRSAHDTPGLHDDHDGEDEGHPVYLQWSGGELDKDTFALLPNDWPYCVPYGVRHYVMWSKVPIVHPHMVNHDPVEWAKIEADGLAGFTGVTPLYRRPNSAAPTHANPDIPWDSDRPPVLLPPLIELGRTLVSANLADDEWYATDMGFAGPEQRKWAGVRYESAGGHEVGRMVRSLFDERGWECLWFVNPPRLQSVPGLSHFHIFARRKTPTEIDAAEAAYSARQAGD